MYHSVHMNYYVLAFVFTLIEGSESLPYPVIYGLLNICSYSCLKINIKLKKITAYDK